VNIQTIMVRAWQPHQEPSKLFEARFAAVLALLFLAAAGALFGIAEYRKTNWVDATGLVTGFKWREVYDDNKPGNRRYDLTINYEFDTPAGKLVSGSDTIHNAKGLKISKGQTINVLYSADEPESNMTKRGLGGVLRFSMMFGFVGLLAATLAYQRWTLHRRSRERA
jgi:hypothetical protein